MRIAFDVSYVQRRRAGYGRLSTELLSALLKADDKNEYILHGWSYSIDFETLRQFQRPNVQMNVKRIPGNIKRWYWTRAQFPPIEYFVGSVDVFHSADPFLPPVRSAKKISTVHDLASTKFPEFFESDVLRMNKHIGQHVASADAIIVPSEHTKLDLGELNAVDPKKVTVIREPVSPIFSERGDPENDDAIVKRFGIVNAYALFVGTFEPRKNIASIVKAFNLLGDTEGLHLVLVGKKGWKYDDVFRLINDSPSKMRIHYLEFVTDEELAVLYRKSLFFVYPSFYEGFGLPVLEAMASGTPIITSNTSSLRELADGVALLVDPQRVNDLVEAMSMLANDEVRRVEMRQRGAYVSRQFTAEAAAKAIQALYKSLV